MNGERYIDHDSAAQVALSKEADPELERLLDEEAAPEGVVLLSVEEQAALGPTKFQLWLVRQTGVSVEKQNAMSNHEWLTRFAGLSSAYDPETDARRRPESHESACNRWPRQG